LPRKGVLLRKNLRTTRSGLIIGVGPSVPLLYPVTPVNPYRVETCSDGQCPICTCSDVMAYIKGPDCEGQALSLTYYTLLSLTSRKSQHFDCIRPNLEVKRSPLETLEILDRISSVTYRESRVILRNFQISQVALLKALRVKGQNPRAFSRPRNN
jgi:hypothetical protein